MKTVKRCRMCETINAADAVRCKQCNSDIEFESVKSIEDINASTSTEQASPIHTDQSHTKASVGDVTRRKQVAGVLLLFSGLACLSIGSGDPTNPAPIAMFLCITCWVGAGLAFAGLKTGVHIVTVIVIIVAVLAINTNASGLRAPHPGGNIIIFFLNGGLAALLAFSASVAINVAHMTSGPSKSGIVITLIHNNSQASKRGLQVDDVIVRYNGHDLTGDMETLLAHMQEASDKDNIPIDFLRDGRVRTCKVRGGPLGVILDSKNSPTAIDT